MTPELKRRREGRLPFDVRALVARADREREQLIEREITELVKQLVEADLEPLAKEHAIALDAAKKDQLEDLAGKLRVSEFAIRAPEATAVLAKELGLPWKAPAGEARADAKA
jgi:hypothetical protein